MWVSRTSRVSEFPLASGREHCRISSRTITVQSQEASSRTPTSPDSLLLVKTDTQYPQFHNSQSYARNNFLIIPSKSFSHFYRLIENYFLFQSFSFTLWEVVKVLSILLSRLLKLVKKCFLVANNREISGYITTYQIF